MPHSVGEPLPAQQTAVIQSSTGAPVVTKTAPVPSASGTSVLIRTAAVALNPTDVKMPTYHPVPGARCGCDFAGTVVALGEGVAAVAPTLKVGDRVCGAVHGANPLDAGSGAFAEYLTAEARLLLKVPDAWSWEAAAALGAIGWGTLGLALWGSLGLEWAAKKATAPPVLVYGAGTATGTMACQLLKLAGYTPLATCSATSAPLAQRYGAAQTFPYTSPTCAADLRAAAGAPIRAALDCITDEESVKTCYAALGRAGGRYACLEACPPEWQTRNAVKSDFVMGYEMFGKEVALAGDYARPADADKFQSAITWAAEMQTLINSGRVLNHPHETLESEQDAWADSVLRGLDRLGRGDVRGVKLVVRVS